VKTSSEDRRAQEKRTGSHPKLEPLPQKKSKERRVEGSKKTKTEKKKERDRDCEERTDDNDWFETEGE